MSRGKRDDSRMAALNVKQAAKLVGRKGFYRHRELGGLLFLVEILNVRSVFGRDEVLIRAARGVGQHWVRLASVKGIR